MRHTQDYWGLFNLLRSDRNILAQQLNWRPWPHLQSSVLFVMWLCSPLYCLPDCVYSLSFIQDGCEPCTVIVLDLHLYTFGVVPSCYIRDSCCVATIHCIWYRTMSVCVFYSNLANNLQVTVNTLGNSASINTSCSTLCPKPELCSCPVKNLSYSQFILLFNAQKIIYHNISESEMVNSALANRLVPPPPQLKRLKQLFDLQVGRIIIANLVKSLCFLSTYCLFQVLINILLCLLYKIAALCKFRAFFSYIFSL